jgi:hypothetical protein
MPGIESDHALDALLAALGGSWRAAGAREPE